MTKHELIVALSHNHNITRDKANAILADVINFQLHDLLENGEVVLHGLGKLKIAERAARLGRNPKTGETIHIPAQKSVKFQITKTLKNELNA